jgi:hypothetical protein
VTSAGVVPSPDDGPELPVEGVLLPDAGCRLLGGGVWLLVLDGWRELELLGDG